MKYSFLVLTSFLFFMSCIAFAADPAKNFEFIATVNGAPITKGLFELNLRTAIAQGQKDTPQLRDSIKNELINRQLIAQEVVKQGLDKDVDLQDQITQLRQNIYLQIFVEDYLKKSPITETQMREEYERQKQMMGGGDTAPQYKISQIVLSSESQAIAVIGRLKSGDAFTKVAKEVSMDTATKAQGGLLGWVSPQQLASPIADAIGPLAKGAFSTRPVSIGGSWVIVRLDDVRSTKIPSFEASQNQLKQAIIQQHISDVIKRLRDSSKIVQ